MYNGRYQSKIKGYGCFESMKSDTIFQFSGFQKVWKAQYIVMEPIKIDKIA